MINKRLLIKNLLSHNDENSFYDKKMRLSFTSKEGKGKFLKHICALSNSNPSVSFHKFMNPLGINIITFDIPKQIKS